MYDDIQVDVPETAYTLDGFRAWVYSPDFPERGQITFFKKQVLVDMSPERVESHNKVKTEINGVIGPLVKQMDIGCFYCDRLWFTNDEADISTEPDATFASWETLEAGRFRVIPMRESQEDGLEMRGTPDWVVEVISTSSVDKDSGLLLRGYYQAGVSEYWLIDARGDNLSFAVFHRGKDGFMAVEPQDGWQTSKVFQRQFRLDRKRDRIGGWQYTLRERTG
jgi:Uma2 family endonuclease